MLTEILEATLKLGLPVACLGWFVLKQLYARGDLDRSHDSRTVAENIKQIRKNRKQNKALRSDLVQTKWMQFGGGFYGCAALWTFLMIELTELMDLLSNFPGFSTLVENGLINLIVSLLLNQLSNFIAAMIWFSYWADGGIAIGIWIAVAYLGYLSGLTVAKQNWHFSRQGGV
ncbi:MAG: hypothetical protein ACFHXK_02240 [bacterium]